MMKRKVMNKNKKLVTISFLILAVLVGCSGQANATTTTTQPAEAAADVALPEEALETPASAEEETQPEQASEDLEQPVASIAYKLSDQPYISPSNAFNVYLPESWNCSETGEYRVDCYNADNTSTLSIRAIGTGYELLQDDFVSLAKAELVSTFEDVKAYAEISQNVLDGTLINESTWREGDVYWQGTDRMVRSGPAVYYLRFASVQDLFEAYRTMFEEIVQKVELNPGAMSGAALYPFTKEFISRELIFSIEVPTSWTEFIDTGSIENTIVNGFISPDKRASVQVATYTRNIRISQEFKGSKSLEIMRKLYGWDLRVPAVDKALQDGREYLVWEGARKGIAGETYFGSVNTTIYIFSILWDDGAKDLYKPVLDKVADSFEFSD